MLPDKKRLNGLFVASLGSMIFPHYAGISPTKAERSICHAHSAFNDDPSYDPFFGKARRRLAEEMAR